jgi:penicillin-binding protein 1A
MALPIWGLYMQRVYRDPKLDVSTGDFPRPESQLDVSFDCEAYRQESQPIYSPTRGIGL